ncbi:MAG: PSD1 and planctomycete cytochrome C domain-containing protein [Gemmataceae bacterium]|nr:PSD1 and planctomycete cytochrome C domain-containing protein [Gemmataceae bacterium]
MSLPRLALTAVVCVAGTARAAEPVDAEFFERKVRPLLVQHCQGCHGADKQKGGLRLLSRADALKGGDTGPALTPGDADKSLLVRMVRYDGDIKMPPKGKLAADEVAALTAWVKGGAPWPDGGAATTATGQAVDVLARAKTHWSFQPVKRPPVPVPGHPIDAFLKAKLDAAGLTFAPPADKRVLLRRVTYDLIGLPPTPAEIDAFLKDDRPDAYERVVERLLASPHYGERWGRHWLDLVRYAETHGHEFDFDIPGAWRYRDYVIRAFNADLPYNRFLTEHIAGDLLPTPRRNPADGTNESVTATGFWFFHEALHSPVDVRKDQADRIDNQIDVFGKAVLGLTVACARCHDHKFDPIATKDYYSLFSVLSSSRYARTDMADPTPAAKVLDELRAARAEPASGGRQPPDPSSHQGADAPRSPGQEWRSKAVPFERFGPGWRDRWDATGLAFRPEAGGDYPHSGRESAKLQGAVRSPTFTVDKTFLAVRVAGQHARARVVLHGLQLIQDPIYGGLAPPSGVIVAEPRWLVFDLRMWKGDAAYFELLDDGPGYAAITEAWFADDPPPDEPGEKVPAPPPAHELEAKLPEPQLAPAIRDGTGRDERVFVRGNPRSPGATAPRGFPAAFGRPAFASAGSGRLELAAAVTDPANPLVARVLVNRVWKHHFGEGIVRSPDDFGAQGQPPTHPELLDWLAAEFVARGWSVKQLHRLILHSAAYRQSSSIPQSAIRNPQSQDPQNKLLHRQTVRRLEAEAVRDAMLAVSGRLDRVAGGPGVPPHLTDHQVGRGRPQPGPVDGAGRRSVYLQVRRNFLPPLLVAFDYPTPFTAIGRRTVSNVPAQALALLNNPFVLGQAELWAKRTLADGGTPEDRVRAMYTAAFGRPPTPVELRTATGFVADAPDEVRTWADLAHALFNSKEFVFVD